MLIMNVEVPIPDQNLVTSQLLLQLNIISLQDSSNIEIVIINRICAHCANLITARRSIEIICWQVGLHLSLQIGVLCWSLIDILTWLLLLLKGLSLLVLLVLNSLLFLL